MKPASEAALEFGATDMVIERGKRAVDRVLQT